MDNRNKALSGNFYIDDQGHLTSTGLSKGIYITGVSYKIDFPPRYYATAKKYIVNIMAANIVFAVNTKLIFKP